MEKRERDLRILDSIIADIENMPPYEGESEISFDIRKQYLVAQAERLFPWRNGQMNDED